MGLLHHLFHSHHGHHGRHDRHGHGHPRGGRHAYRGHHAGFHHHHHQHQQHRHGRPFDDEGAFFGAEGGQGAQGGEQAEHIDRIDYLAQKVARRLDLDRDQLARLKTLIECLQQQRQAVRGGDWLQDAAQLLNGRAFDRDGAHALAQARIARIQAGVPAVADAVAGFYDALDADQQHVLRFFIRLGRRGRGAAQAEDGAAQHGAGEP